MAGESSKQRPKQSGAAVFWLLMLMGLATFAPCIILPQWRQYQALDMAAQIEQHHLDVLQRSRAVLRHADQVPAGRGKGDFEPRKRLRVVGDLGRAGEVEPVALPALDIAERREPKPGSDISARSRWRLAASHRRSARSRSQ